MNKFNRYTEELDLSALKDFFVQHGRLRHCMKKDFWLRQGERSRSISFIEKGSFRCLRMDESGKEHVVGYAFSGEFLGDYPSFCFDSPALVSLQAMEESSLYCLSKEDLYAHWERDMDTQRERGRVAEKLLHVVYQRLLDSYTDTPFQAYTKLVGAHPELLQKVSLKELASFLRVTPETVSHIRRKLLHDRGDS